MALADLNTLINASAQNLSQFKGLTAAYVVTGFGVPSIAGYTALINENNSTNFGAGGTTVFNDENIYINTLNALYQGNADARTAFDAILVGAASVQDKLNAIYNATVPSSAQTDAGRAYFQSQAEFYANRAAELNIPGDNGFAVVAQASLLKIVVDADLSGIGDSINDLRAAVADGSAVIADAAAFTPLETADGTNFDADDNLNPDAGATTFTLTPGLDFADVAGSGRAGPPFIPTDFKFTSSNETVNATNVTLTAGDTLSDGSTTDEDRLAYTGVVVTSIGAAGAIQNIENFDINLTNATNSAANLANTTGLKAIKVGGSVGGGQIIAFNTVALSGLASFDTTGATGANAGSQIQLVDGAANQIITYRGGGISDFVALGNGNNDISTGGGNDFVFVVGGDNKIDTGAGNDTVGAGNGDNEISTGDGNDTVGFGNGVNTVDTGAGNDTVNGGNGNNTVALGDGNNAATLGNGANTVTGGAGVDTIIVGNGANTISTGAGNDVITVGTGSNTITAGAGADTINLTAANGVNTLIFAAGDSGVGGFDLISGFDVTGATRDKLDFAGAEAGDAANVFYGGAVANFAAAQAAAQAQFDADVTTVYFVADDGVNSWVFVDVEKADLVGSTIDFAVQLTGIVNSNTIELGSFV